LNIPKRYFDPKRYFGKTGLLEDAGCSAQLDRHL
jgi:hypothetical protein